MIRNGLDKHNGIYQDRTTQPHLAPCQECLALWFLVGLGCLRKLGGRESLCDSEQDAVAPYFT